MNKQLEKIFATRYKVPVMLLVISFFLLYLFQATSFVSTWNNQKEYLESDDFKTEFYSGDYDFPIDYDNLNDKPIYAKTLEEYQLNDLQVFDKAYSYRSNMTFSPEKGNNPNNYQVGESYWQNYGGGDWIPLMAFVLFILGFLLFFIDLKTNFNQFLFSLSFTKKELFRGKMIYVVLPILVSLALGIISSIFIRYFSIPAPYFNVTLPQMLYSGLSHWIYLALLFAIGIFLGTLLGNLILAPTVLGIVLLSLTLTTDIYYDIMDLIYYFFEIEIPYDLDALMVDYPGKSGTPWFFLVLYLLFILLNLFLAERVYQNMSLENNGRMITVPRFRRVTFISLTILSLLWFTLPVSSLKYHIIYKPEYPSYLPLIFVLIACPLTSFFLVYIDEIPKQWQKFTYQRAIKKSN